MKYPILSERRVVGLSLVPSPISVQFVNDAVYETDSTKSVPLTEHKDKINQVSHGNEIEREEHGC